MSTIITQLSSDMFQMQTYQTSQVNLIPQFSLDTFLSNNSKIEFIVLDVNKNVLSSTSDFKDYSLPETGINQPGAISSILLDPESDLFTRGYNLGQYIAYYNFLVPKIGTLPTSLYISEISSDRTELRLDSTELDLFGIIDQTSLFVQERENSPYFIDFYLGFGDNQYVLANNIRLDDQDINNPTILVKLYDSLPLNFNLNDTLYITTFLEDPLVYQVDFQDEPIQVIDYISIGGPNFNLPLKDQVNNSTQPLSFSDITSTSLTSSFNQLNSLLEENELDINVNYTSFPEFIHFSSAQTRLENFYYKIGLIENYSSSIAVLDSTTSSPTEVDSSVAVYEAKIDNIITNFDGYEYFLYYDNSSYAWPKTNSQKPYELAKIGSTAVNNWFGSINESSPIYGGIILSASVYDNDNKDNLLFSIPEYLRDDSDNEPYELFVSMVAQHYDNIWIYYKDVTNKYDADNRLHYGISNDIVADAIRDFGVKLYQNNFSNEDLYTAFLGLTPEGGLFPFPNITGSLPTPSGYEYVDILISASNDYLPLDDVNKSLYKRIYHNIPYLLKSKGTLPGLRALITSYGIPDTILRINEFGGKDKINSNDWDNWQEEFNYAYTNNVGTYIYTPWDVNLDWNSPDDVPSTVKFRFKTTEFPGNPAPLSQSLWYTNGNVALNLIYTGSGYTSGSYSGSIIDPYYQYANLIFYPDHTNYPNSTASLYLPFFDGGWWSAMVTRNGDDFGLYAGNKMYGSGENNTTLGFYASSSINEDSSAWINPSQTSIFGNLFKTDIVEFKGLYQEIRYYTTPISESVFKDYIMNPYSTEGNSINSSPDELIFRATLGGELYTDPISIHPKVTGSWVTTSSFASDSNFNFTGPYKLEINREYFFADQPVAGIKNIINDKIRVEDNIMPEGDTLSPFMALSQQLNVSQSYTPNTNYLEVAFSPQNEINEDIVNQIGYFNIGDYIGDPRQRFTPNTNYPDLDKLRNDYFEKYTKNYNLTDFIRLIKFFDNSLFKMIQDFVPARTSLASGVVIKQHLLERNKYPQPQINWEDLDISGTIKPQWNDYQPGTIEHFDGGAGGVVNQFNYLTNTSQSWYDDFNSPLGPVIMLHNNQDEFYNGELSGSNILVTNGILNPAYPLDFQSFEYKQIHYYSTLSNENDILKNNFLNFNTSPQNGEILLYSKPRGIFGPPSPPYNLWNTEYIKISKFDNNGNNNSTVLENVTKILIYSSFYNTYVPYEVTILNEQQDYYLYSTSFLYIPSLFPNQVLNYSVSSSITSSYGLYPGFEVIVNSWDTEIGNSLNYFNTSSGKFIFGDTPNTQLSITASVTTNGSVPSTGQLKFVQLRNGVETTLSAQNYNANSIETTIISSSFYPIQNDQYYVKATRGNYFLGILTVVNANLSLTQSRALSSSAYESTIFEPYITTANFYNSDENALLNNVSDIRLSTVYQDIDYSTDLLTPVNFDLLIDNEALKAAVQDSNYTTKRHIIPRYLGSKSTSQRLNTWTQGDEGTFGKTPTIESLKTAIAYCDWIGGWSPEKMNASAAHVLYLIYPDGTVTVPNTSENSLTNLQGNFQSGERFTVQSSTQGSGDPIQYRNIIRGGSRIEPILYTQSGSAPNAQWVNNISLIDNYEPGNILGDYQAKLNTTTYQINPITSSANTWQEILFNSVSPKGIDATTILSPLPSVLGATGKRYKINNGFITDGISLTITVLLKASVTSPTNIYNGKPYYTGGSNNMNAKYIFRIVRLRGTDKTGIFTSHIPNGQNEFYSAIINHDYTELTGNISIPYDQLKLNDEFYVEVQIISPQGLNNPVVYIESNSSIQFNQSPIPTTNTTVANLWVSSSGISTDTIVTYFNSSSNYFSSPYLIYTTASSLVTYYQNEIVSQKDISGSGFNSITLPWSIEYGDEFRFDGREDRVYTVVQADVVPSASGDDSVLAVQLDRPIPESGSLINYDRFLIRRYVDDASQILFEGFKPTTSTGPYLLKPEYVSPELNKNIDTIILDLTQKGLI